jgi:hypothetical protein
VNKEALYIEGKKLGGEYGKPDIGSNLDTFASTPAELAAGDTDMPGRAPSAALPVLTAQSRLLNLLEKKRKIFTHEMISPETST